MAFNLCDLPSLTIPSGLSTSNAITLFDDAYGISIQAPATITASQVTVQVAVSSGASAAFVDLISGNTAVIIQQGWGRVITPLPYRQIRITSTSAEGADRVFLAAKVFLV